MQIRPPPLIAGASAALTLFREAPGALLGPLQSRQGGRGGGALAAPFPNAVSCLTPDRLCSPQPCRPEPASFGDLTSAFLLTLRLAFEALQKPALKPLWAHPLQPPPHTEPHPRWPGVLLRSAAPAWLTSSLNRC